MPEWKIMPLEGLGELRFGMSRQKVRTLLGDDFTSVERYRKRNLRDAYIALGLLLDYDEDEDRLEFIETVPPCDPVYKDIHFFGREVETLLKELADLGYPAEEDATGYSFDELGIALYLPENRIETVSIYPKGYYERAFDR